MGMVFNGIKNVRYKYNKMKKYFIKETGEEIQFGEHIVLDFTKDAYGKIIHHHLDCKFIPELIPLFMENDIVVSKEIDDFKENTGIDNPSTPDYKELEDRIVYLEGKVADLEKAVNTNIKNIAYLFNKKSQSKNV